MKVYSPILTGGSSADTNGFLCSPGGVATSIVNSTIAQGGVSGKFTGFQGPICSGVDNRNTAPILNQLQSAVSSVDVNKLLQPEEIANVAVFLSSSLASGINGQHLTVDKGAAGEIRAGKGILVAEAPVSFW